MYLSNILRSPVSLAPGKGFPKVDEYDIVDSSEEELMSEFFNKDAVTSPRAHEAGLSDLEEGREVPL